MCDSAAMTAISRLSLSPAHISSSTLIVAGAVILHTNSSNSARQRREVVTSAKRFVEAADLRIVVGEGEGEGDGEGEGEGERMLAVMRWRGVIAANR